MNKTKEIIEMLKKYHEMMKDLDKELVEDYTRGTALRIEDLVSENDWPKEGDKFWYFDNDGEIIAKIYKSNIYWYDDLITFGNCFKTEKEATEARDKVKQLLNELR